MSTRFLLTGLQGQEVTLDPFYFTLLKKYLPKNNSWQLEFLLRYQTEKKESK